MKTLTCLLAINFCLGFTTFSQSNPNTILSAIFQNIKTGKIQAIDTKPLYQTANHTKVFSLLAPYYTDTLSAVRDKAYEMAASVGAIAANKELRTKSVNMLVAGCKDKDKLVAKSCAKRLEKFQKSDFDAGAVYTIKELLSSQNTIAIQLAGIAGFLAFPEAENILLNKLSQQLSGKEKWQIRLALARLGNQENLEFVLRKVRSVTVNDDVIYEAVPLLVYTRQKDAIDYLFSIVQSDEKSCTSAHPDYKEPILCGYRVLEYLAPVIKDFPVKVDGSGELKGDYATNLQLARMWIKQNNEYAILSEGY